MSGTKLSWRLFNETGRVDHCGKEKQSHLLKHALTSNHPVADLSDLKVLHKNYHGDKYRTISEALYIKYDRPSPNAQEQSIQLKLN